MYGHRMFIEVRLLQLHFLDKHVSFIRSGVSWSCVLVTATRDPGNLNSSDTRWEANSGWFHSIHHFRKRNNVRNGGQED
jgi:hypothetical protein